MNGKREEVYGTYDAIVSGGGLIGLSCAITLARAGKKAALVERRSALGWEIGRARCATVGISQALAGSPLIEELAETLGQWSSTDGGTRASVAELLFDRWAMESGVEVLFHGWSSRIVAEDRSVKGLVVGTREGYRLLQAPLLVETDDSGRLIDEDYRKSPLPRSIHRAIYLRHAETDGNQAFVLSDGRKLYLRSEASGRVRADLELKEAARAMRDQEFHLTIPEAVRTIREQTGGCAKAKAFYWAEEEWASPAFRLEDGFADGGDLSFSKYKGVVFAGVWLPRWKGEYDGTPDVHLQTMGVINRLLLGEAAAKHMLTECNV